jgi:hypothetical protein
MSDLQLRAIGAGVTAFGAVSLVLPLVFGKAES